MRFAPDLRSFCFDLQRHRELQKGKGRMGHDFANDFDRCFELAIRHLENNLVAHSRKHLRGKFGAFASAASMRTMATISQPEY